MRPAVHASILRNRSQRSRRVNRPHTFSMRRLLLLAFIGSVFFIPGIVMTIVGLEKTKEETDAMVPSQRIMYKAIGPALTTLGVAVLFSACVYYYCYGTGETNRGPGGSHQSSINSDHSHHHHGHHGHHGHHHLGHSNGSQLNTPDGSIRRLSFKNGDQNFTPQASPLLVEEEQFPLAPSENVPVSSPRDIRQNRAPEAASEDEVQERELLVNGEVPCRQPPAV